MSLHASTQELHGRVLRNLYDSANQAERSRLIAHAYIRTVLQTEDLTLDGRAALDEAEATLYLQAQGISHIKDFLDLLPVPSPSQGSPAPAGTGG